jgi:hypothetical protein
MHQLEAERKQPGQLILQLLTSLKFANINVNTNNFGSSSRLRTFGNLQDIIHHSALVLGKCKLAEVCEIWADHLLLTQGLSGKYGLWWKYGKGPGWIDLVQE